MGGGGGGGGSVMRRQNSLHHLIFFCHISKTKIESDVGLECTRDIKILLENLLLSGRGWRGGCRKKKIQQNYFQ